MRITVRPYTPNDAEMTADLFYNTVHAINCRDYTKEQLNVWAPKSRDLEEWNRSFRGKRALIAEIGGTLVGFADMDINVSCSMCAVGYIDRLYVHKDYQQKGIATALLRALENYAYENAAGVMMTYASITAKPFFGKRGYEEVCENSVERDGVSMMNFLMKKEI